jgi:ATP-dependent Clp protease ATP-binding subunit ClpB
MDINRFTQKAQEAVVGAQSLAKEHSHGQIEPEHLLLALLRQTEGIVPQIVRKLEANPAEMALERALDGKAKVYGATAQVGLSRDLDRAIGDAEKIAKRMRDDYVSTEHLLLALTGANGGEAARFLAAHGITEDAVLRALTAVRGSQREVQDPLALALLRGEFAEGDTVQVDVSNGEIVFERSAGSANAAAEAATVVDAT